MGRGGRTREQKPLPLEKPVPRKLSPEEYDRVAHQLAVKGHAIRGLKRTLSATTRDTRKDIKQLEAERATLEDMLIWHEQLLPQTDLKFSPVEAVTAIAAVATVAGDGPPPVAPEMPPAAHTFVPDKKGEGTCWACGKPKDDAMHGAAAPPPADCGDQPSKIEGLTNREAIGALADVYDAIAPGTGPAIKAVAEQVLSRPPEVDPDTPHAYVEATAGPSRCGVCGGKKRRAQHRETTAAAPAVVPTDPHAFFGTAAGPDCRICGSGPNDPVHTAALEAAASGPPPGEAPAAPDPAFAFDENEPRPSVIASHPLQPESGS